MNLATINDLKRMFEMAINEDRYHVAITIENEGQLECNCYFQDIDTKEVKNLLKEKPNND